MLRSLVPEGPIHLPPHWERRQDKNSKWIYRVKRMPLGWTLRYSRDGNPYFHNSLRNFCTRDDPRADSSQSLLEKQVKNDISDTSSSKDSTSVLRRTATGQATLQLPHRSFTVPTSDEKYPQFQHESLPGPTSIRLLKWFGREDSGLVSFSIEQFDIDKAPPYIALSYTWRSPISKVGAANDAYDMRLQWPVLCDNKILLVSRNLHDFLQQKDPAYDDWNDAVVGGSALHYAAHRGRSETVADLVEIGANINHCDIMGRTPLYLACLAGHKDVVTLLLRLGADKEIRTNEKATVNLYTPLHAAVAGGHLAVAATLLDAGANIEAKLKNGPTPLHQATLRENAAMVDLLLSHGANIETEAPIEGKDVSAGTPVITAVIQGDMTCVRALVEHGANLNATNGYGRTALHCAVSGEASLIVRYLLQKGANPSIKSMNIGWSPLHGASIYGKPEIVMDLLNAGASIDDLTEEEHTRTPLHLACEFDQVENIRSLLERGASVNLQRARDKRTPLHISSGNLSPAAVKQLLEKHADVNALDSELQTPLHRAILQSNVKTEEDLDEKSFHEKQDSSRYEVVMLLLNHGAQVDCRDNENYTPLHFSARYGREKIISLLLDSGASPAARSDRGYTPLILAAGAEHPETMQLLLGSGSRLEEMDDLGRTPIHTALHWESPTTAKILVEAGADLNATASDGYTPLQEAAIHGLLDITRLLLDSGVTIDAENKHGQTALDLAILEGKEDCANLLKDRGARPSKYTIKSNDANVDRPQEALDAQDGDKIETEEGDKTETQEGDKTETQDQAELDSGETGPESILANHLAAQDDELYVPVEAKPETEIPSRSEGGSKLMKLRYLWVDAICIDQADDKEKMEQVNLMSRIYRRAALVHVWLGLEDEDTKLASEALRKIVAYHSTKYKGMESNYDPDLTIWWHMRKEKVMPKEVTVNVNDENIDIPIADHNWLIRAEEWDAFAALIHRQWFQRVWVLQEVARAKHVQMSLGAQNIIWEDLYRALMILTPARDIFSSGPHIWKRVSEGTTAFICAEMHSRLNPGDDYALNSMAGIISWSPTSRLPLSALLLLTWNFRATDARDKVYALLGLAKDQDAIRHIQPDYQESAANPYIEAAKLLMDGFEPIDDLRDSIVDVTKKDIPDLAPLEILTFASHAKYFSRDGLPSWAPDFGSPPHGPRLWYATYYPSDLRERTEWSFPSLGILRTRGSINETIVQVEARDATLPPDHANAFIQWLYLLPKVIYKDSFKAIWRCLAAFRRTDRLGYGEGDTEEAFTKYLEFCAKKRILYEQSELGKSERDLLDWRKNWGRLLDPEIEVFEEDLNKDEGLRTRFENYSLDNFYYELRAFLAPLRHFMKTRVLFRADSDNMGVAPQDTRVGDRICSIGGACTLFVVRKVQEEPEQWRFIGEVYMPHYGGDQDVRELEFQ